MKKRLAAFLLAMAAACGVLLCACTAAPVSLPAATDAAQTDARTLAAARVQYRDASLIVSGACIQKHTNAAGDTCYDLRIEEILAGNAAVGDVVHCTSGSMEPGSAYLLYLGEDTAHVHYAEDSAGYSLLSAAPLKIVDSDVIWEGSRISYGALKADIEQLSSVISAPAPLYYYSSLRTLAEAASEIFIGRVLSLPDQSGHTFLMRTGGAAEKLEYPAAIATVQAFGSVKGALRYGETIELVHCPARMGEMVDAATLQPADAGLGAAATLQEGGFYIFFLNGGTDAKQEYYFPVNPMQGYLLVEGEAVDAQNAGLPLSVYNELTPLVQALQRAMRNEIEAVDPPALIVE